MELIVYAIYIVLFIFLVDYIIKPRHKNVLPHRIPIIGHVLLFRGDHINRILCYWSQKYGSRYTIQILHKHVVVLNSYEDIYEMLVTKGKEFGGRFQNFRTKTFFDNGVVFANYSQEWNERKTLVQRHLRQHGEGIGDSHQLAIDIARQLTAEIRRNTSTNPVYDPFEDVRLASLNYIFSLITGAKYNINDIRDEFKQWFEMSELINTSFSLDKGFMLDLFPFLRFFGNSTYKQCKRYMHKLNDTVNDIYDKIEKKDHRYTSHGLAKALLETGKYTGINKDTMQVTLSDVSMAGSVTTSVSLYCLLQILAQEPNIQQRISDEIQLILKKNNSQFVTLENQDDMPYTRACLLELMRYITLAPIAIPHRSLVPTMIASEYFEKGTIFIPNLVQLHHDEKYWDNPWEFQPERYLDGNGHVISPDHDNRKRLLPFGAGLRTCVGQNLAMGMLFIFITCILREFEVSVYGNERHDPQKYDADITIEPPRYPIKFTARN